ncbi:MAG: glycosyltransferase [Bacilli bacterium]|nr:glycosyltransferase [Bacilli bacterium]
MKKNKVEVSIIMSEYNTPVELLKESIQSLLNQTFKNFELIIVDDCGKNDLSKVVKEFNDDRIIVLKNKKNMGLVASLNKAIKASNSDYLVRMDTDDYSYPNRIELEYNFIKKHPEYAVVGMQCEFYDGKEIYGKSHKSGELTKIDLINQTLFIHPSVIMKKEVIEKIGMYPDYQRCEDFALWINLIVEGYRGYVMDEVGIRYTIREEDYIKRTLKTRKGLFKLLNENYQKLNPTKKQTLKLKLKNFVAGIVPGKIMYKYHKKRCKNEK